MKYFSILFLSVALFFSCNGNNDPVPDQLIEVSKIILSEHSLSLETGVTVILSAEVLPADAADKAITWSSSNADVASVIDGVVSANSAGNALIIAHAGTKVDTCAVTVENNPLTYDVGVLINGVRWATRNLATTGEFVVNPEDLGGHFQWNRIDTINFMLYDNYYASNFPNTTFWLPENDPSPAEWRVPTFNEIQTLLDTDNVTEEWTILNGVSGMRFADIATGNSIFLPAAGYLHDNDGILYNASTQGTYWSSDEALEFPVVNSYFILFFNDFTMWLSTNKADGLSIRPVAK